MSRESAITLKSEMTDAEVYSIKNAIKDSKLTGLHIEIGTAAGGTLCEILKCYQNELKVVPPISIASLDIQFFSWYFKVATSLLMKPFSRSSDIILLGRSCGSPYPPPPPVTILI